MFRCFCSIICQISTNRMFVSDELMKCWKKCFSLKCDVSLRLLPSGESSRNFMDFKPHIIFFDDFSIICQISGIRMFVPNELIFVSEELMKWRKTNFRWNSIFPWDRSPPGSHIEILWILSGILYFYFFDNLPDFQKSYVCVGRIDEMTEKRFCRWNSIFP